MKTSTCASCGFAFCKEETYTREIEHGDSTIAINGLKRFECRECEAVFSDDGQSRYNLSLIQRAKGLTPNLVFGTEIRAFRDSICITQREASRIFGGGLNAFSKYETGEIVQSDAMDNLLWLTSNFPGLVPALAKRRNVELSDKVRAACGTVLQISLDATSSFSRGMHRYAFAWKKYSGPSSFHTSDLELMSNKNAFTFPSSANDADYQMTNANGA